MEADIKADMTTEDRGEFITLMEPLLVSSTSRFRPYLADLALELTAKSTALRTSLPAGIVRALSDLVRSMNCYYSIWGKLIRLLQPPVLIIDCYGYIRL